MVAVVAIAAAAAAPHKVADRGAGAMPVVGGSARGAGIVEALAVAVAVAKAAANWRLGAPAAG